jgi:hypothetical protein
VARILTGFSGELKAGASWTRSVLADQGTLASHEASRRQFLAIQARRLCHGAEHRQACAKGHD